jgi:succinate-semialdehyde dehydrogenase / glutarate-semialdehyde dehydrogenase
MSGTSGAPISGYAVVDPTTGETVQTYPTITNDALGDAIDRAGETHRTWSRSTSVDDRAALVLRVATLHVERQDALAAIIAREMGKPIGDALGEINFSAAIYQFYADNAEQFLADEPITLMGGEGSALSA